MSERDETSALADPGTRALAKGIDATLPFVAWLLPVTTAVVIGSPAVIYAAAGLSLTLTLTIVVTNVVLLARHGQTIGKRALGLRILRVDGSRAGLARILLARIGLPFVLGLLPLFEVVDALAVFSKDRRCLHDRFADTIVVDLRYAAHPKGSDAPRVA